jgi:hypothetical protein
MLAVALALSLAAPPAAAAPLDIAAAYERLKALEGSWKTDARDGDVRFVRVRVVGGGAAVLETTTEADRTAVTSMTVYAREGNELAVTHYSAAGVTRLKLRAADATSLTLDAAQKDGKLLGLSLGISEKELIQEWTVRELGRETKQRVKLLREFVDTLK